MHVLVHSLYMQTLLLAVNTEDHTFCETVMGIFPDTQEGLALAVCAAEKGPDMPYVYRVPMGVTTYREEVW